MWHFLQVRFLLFVNIAKNAFLFEICNHSLVQSSPLNKLLALVRHKKIKDFI